MKKSFLQGRPFLTSRRFQFMQKTVNYADYTLKIFMGSFNLLHQFYFSGYFVNFSSRKIVIIYVTFHGDHKCPNFLIVQDFVYIMGLDRKSDVRNSQFPLLKINSAFSSENQNNTVDDWGPLTVCVATYTLANDSLLKELIRLLIRAAV